MNLLNEYEHLAIMLTSKRWSIPTHHFPTFYGGHVRLRHNRIALLWVKYKRRRIITLMDMRVAFAQWSMDTPITPEETKKIMGETCKTSVIKTSMKRIEWHTSFPRDPVGSAKCHMKWMPKRVSDWIAKYGDENTICFIICMMSVQRSRWNYLAFVEVEHYALRSGVRFVDIRRAMETMKEAGVIQVKRINEDGAIVIEFCCKAPSNKG